LNSEQPAGGESADSERRSDTWRTVACAAPALFYGLVEMLPLPSDGLTAFEMQLTRLGWLCLFFSPAFLPWVTFFARRAWRRAERRERLILACAVLSASVPALLAIRWALALIYPPTSGHRWMS